MSRELVLCREVADEMDVSTGSCLGGAAIICCPCSGLLRPFWHGVFTLRYPPQLTQDEASLEAGRVRIPEQESKKKKPTLPTPKAAQHIMRSNVQ